VGVVSPIGIGADAFWQALCEGRSGVTHLSRFDTSNLPVRIGAEVADFEPKLYIKPRKSMKLMCREIQYAFAAAAMAVEDATLDVSAVDPNLFGIVFGCEMLYGEVDELEELYRGCMVNRQFDFARFGERIRDDMYPLWMLKYLPNMAACHIAISYDARGPNNTISQAEASSLLALVETAATIERGHADVVITGGSGTRISLTPLMYRGDSNLSHQAEPAIASRPFDALRDGMVNGEGAAAFVVENRAHAEQRGARILARISGFGRTCGVRRNGQLQSGSALRGAIEESLRSARVQPRDVGHVNAHGVSTVEADASEAQTIQAVLGDVPVTAPKSFFGNLGAGGGAVEMAASVLGFRHGQVPVTLNYRKPDPACPVAVIHDQPLPITDQRVAVLLNMASTGQAVAVVLDDSS
jgi:3-oxoacyl-[acyl-carrier-protein] synthase II